MSAYSTTDPVTPSVTFEAYSSPCQRVLYVLRAWMTPGETMQIVNRDLAIAAQCSAGSIPTILRTLERDGWIERVTSTQGSLVLLVDQSLDRAAHAERRSNIDRVGMRSNADRAEVADSAPPCDLTPSDPISFRITESGDPKTDPPHTPHKEFNHDSMQQQHARVVKPKNPHQDALRLLRDIEMFGAELDRAVGTYGYTTAQIGAMWAAAQTRTDIADPRRLLYRCLVDNQPLYSQEELDARQATNAAAGGVAAHRRQRSAPAAAATRSAEERAAFRAKLIAANPHLQL